MIETAPGRGGAGRLRRRTDGAPPEYREVPAHEAVPAHARASAASRFRLLVWEVELEADRGLELHELSRFAGSAASTETVVLDNLREGVITSDVYDAG